MPPPADSALRYPLAESLPEPGRSLEVAPGVRWLRMPLPFALDHINLWLLRDEVDGQPGWTVVDCGVDQAQTRSAWEQVFSQELQGLPVLRVIVTHMHPDHIGLAHWLTGRWSAPGRSCRLWISAADWNAARLACRGGTGPAGEQAADFYALHGLGDAKVLDSVRGLRGDYADLVPEVPATHRRLMHGQVLRIGGRDWTCLAGHGHSPEHIALHCPALGVLIAGDMVLPRITTNISVWGHEPEGDPLALYLASLAAMRALPAGTLVLPSHGKPFTGLHERIDQLETHHAERLAAIEQACARAAHSALDLLPTLFKRRLEGQQLLFALGEAVAHLHCLLGRGLLRAEPGGDGVLRWRAAG
jgi:glyoxylase-like metal-dependent hydrolase (beta-lactamase superfamily II)